jgi:hypothetical protein
MEDRETSIPERTSRNKETLKDFDVLQMASLTTAGIEEKWLGVADGWYRKVKRDSEEIVAPNGPILTVELLGERMVTTGYYTYSISKLTLILPQPHKFVCPLCYYHRL